MKRAWTGLGPGWHASPRRGRGPGGAGDRRPPPPPPTPPPHPLSEERSAWKTHNPECEDGLTIHFAPNAAILRWSHVLEHDGTLWLAVTGPRPGGRGRRGVV